MGIIIEGPNGVGKTTLASKLSCMSNDVLGFYNCVYHDISSETKILNNISESLKLTEHKNTIFDRFPIISESIYSEYVGHRRPLVKTKIAIDCIKGINPKKALFVFLSPISIVETYERQHNKTFGLSTYSAICHEYENMISQLEGRQNVMVLYGSTFEPEEVMDFYLRVIRKV